MRTRGGFCPVDSSGPPRIKRQGENAITFDGFAVGIARCIDFAKAKPREESHGSMVLGGDGCVKRPYRELGLEEIYRRDTRLRGDAATPECGSEYIGEVRGSTRVDGRLHIADTSIGGNDPNHPVQPELRPVSGRAPLQHSIALAQSGRRKRRLFGNEAVELRIAKGSEHLDGVTLDERLEPQPFCLQGTGRSRAGEKLGS